MIRRTKLLIVIVAAFLAGPNQAFGQQKEEEEFTIEETEDKPKTEEPAPTTEEPAAAEIGGEADVTLTTAAV